MKTRLYFAYGTNMRFRREEHGIKPLGGMVLPGFELSFYSFATVDLKEGGKVYGALYEITKDAEKMLDRYEGYAPDGRGYYRKETVRVRLPDAVCKARKIRMGSEGNVLVYVMNDHAKKDRRPVANESALFNGIDGVRHFFAGNPTAATEGTEDNLRASGWPEKSKQSIMQRFAPIGPADALAAL